MKEKLQRLRAELASDRRAFEEKLREIEQLELEGLRRLLAFRHFFRHAYSAALDPTRLRELRREAMCLREPLRADLDGLDSFLRDLAEVGA